VLRIFDNTFRITSALELIAIVVAILGVVSTLLALILERKREIGILRLLGATRKQIIRMVLLEALMIGCVSQATGVVVGLLLSLVLVYVINVQSFGWTIQFSVPLWFVLQSTALIILTSILSGIIPARAAARVGVLEPGDV
jgi:putative ABC transport system permease protein